MLTNIPGNHKSKLRAQLLAHADEHLPKKHRSVIRFWPLLAVPFTAVALFALTTIWKPIESPSNPIIKQVAGPLTVDKVFAEAIKYIDKQTLKPGEYYYTRSLQRNTYNDKDAPDPGNTCIHVDQYTVTYANSQGVSERMEAYDKNNRLYSVQTTTRDGRDFGPKFYYDAALAKANETTVPCPPMIVTPLPDGGPVDIEAYLQSPEYQLNEDILSGIPDRQKSALNTLKSIGDYQIFEHYQIPEHPKPVTMLASGYGERRSVYYFDQETKAFVGTGYHDRSYSIILEQDIRKLPDNDPPEYSKPHPPQM